MPHINRIRVNNVKYNFGTQFYDDFIMRFSGKNTIYDLANGGGKSVLMLLLLQNMIPNCTLDDKQPIEKLFRTGSGSNTIHSLVEWNLSDVHVKNNYKYMLTGFCARKARDEEKSNENAAAIDYFNYVILYREYNDNDLKNLPLSVPSSKNPAVKERITYNGLKNYLRDLEKKDYSLEVKIFERKGDYQRFISEYGIYESEWEIIRGINKTEGHVRTYFETNYKTTRKVVEDLLIEQIIEKSFKNAVFSGESAERHDNTMVETLMDIKDKLVELSEKKNDIHNYDHQMELIGDFVEHLSGIKKLYFGQEDLEKDLVMGYRALKAVKEELEQRKETQNEEITALDTQKMQEKRDIEIIGIQKYSEKIEKLAQNTAEMKMAEQYLETEIENLKEALTIAESRNDYLDYLYYKKERDTIRENIESITKDESQLYAELRKLAIIKKTRDEVRFASIKKKCDAEEEELKRESDIAKGLKIRQEELAKSQAVAQYKVEEGRKTKEELNAEIAEQKHSIDLVMVYDLKKEKKENENKLTQCEEEKRIVEEKLEKNSEGRKGLEAEKQLLESALVELEDCLNENVNRRRELSKYQTKLEKLKSIYGEKHLKNLIETLQSKQKKTEEKQKEIQIKKQKTEKIIHGLKNGCPVEQSEQLEKVLAYLNRFHGDAAILGTDYIRETPKEKRQELLEQAPMLPYGVVVKKYYESVAGDTGLYGLDLEAYQIPIIHEQALQDGEYLNSSDVTYAMCKKELFFDEKIIQAELVKEENEGIRLETEEGRIRENLEAYEKDLEFLELYRREYAAQIQEYESAYEAMKLQKKEKEIQILRKQEELDVLIKSHQVFAEEQRTLQLEKEKLQKREDVIMLVCDMNQKVAELEQEIKQGEESYGAAKTELANVTGRLEAWESKEAARKKVINAFHKEEEELKADWEVYRRYYDDSKMKQQENLESMEENNLTDDEIEAKFKGAAEALEGGNSTLTDKQKLLENYEIAMEKSLQAIDYKGISVQTVQERFEQGEKTPSSKEELLEQKKKIEERSSRLKEKKKQIALLQSEMDKLEGAVGKGKEAIIEKYGNYEEIVLNGISPEEYVNEKKQIIKNIEERLEAIAAIRKEMEEQDQKLTLGMHDMEKVVTDTMLSSYEGSSLEVSENIVENIEKYMKKYAKFQNNISEKKEEFEQEKNKLVQTLRLMKAAALADEITQNAIMPDSITATDLLMEGLKEIVTCLELEKERISKSIEDMERIKENFESQCIQSCINMKTELEKLPKLSKIVMDGESIPIIFLSIPFVEEELYKEKMADYINETVEQADTIKNETERVKFIKGRLSWKKLFAVIVTDMNSIRLNLYKRERMKEQSRYLKYEEAVGSTGQSQGIYIQFLIAVINYISSINSRDTDSVALLKVIFIDNPFGAAKDIYIWEPIFKMLKTNNVQLIVPCRGATPAITGRFDVNYVLGQKLIDGKQQTVVVDYYSNLNSEKLDYTTMTYEQEKLDFLT